jgi:hypothetical protein
MRLIPIAAAFAGLAAIGPALADDSTAELATGGLAFVQTNDITMQSEDLYVSMDAIKARYEFVNTSDHDVTTLVAFPLPDIKGDPDLGVAVPTEDPVNFVGFRTVVDGAPVTTQVQQRVSSLGIDQTALLKSLGIPLAPQLEATGQALDALPRDQWDQLVKLGLVSIDQYDVGKGMEDHLTPLWVLSTDFYWEQSFPAHKTVRIEHDYVPSVGSTAGLSFGTPESRKEAWFKDHYLNNYCIDSTFLAAVDRSRKADGSDTLTERRIDFVLKTGSNWESSIHQFHVVIDKGSPKNLVSFCGEDVKKTGPTTFEMTKTDFEPDQDLAILILTPMQEQ